MAKKTKNLKYYEAVGRRKTAVARVRFYLVGRDKTVIINNSSGEGKTKMKQGEIYLNGRPIKDSYFSQVDQARYLFPLKQTNNDKRFAISIVTHSGGQTGQLEAIIHGLSRAIEKVDRDQYRPTLKKLGLLTRDARIRERRKVGTGGKARRTKQSPKR